jgi:hypothetical protein
MAVLFGYQQFLQWRYPNLYGPRAKHATASPTAGGPGEIGATPGLSPSGIGSLASNNLGTAPGIAGNATPKAAAGGLAAGTERSVTIETDLYTATLSGFGGRLVSFKLKK